MSAEDLAVLAGEATGEMVVAENAPGDVQAEALRVQAASTLYDVLGVTKAATEIEIRRNYRKVCSHQPGMLRPVRTRLAVEPAHFFHPSVLAARDPPPPRQDRRSCRG